jgi:predicted DsbA family dithiol-disulfide isomerase
MLQARLYFDYIDPGSLLMGRRLEQIAGDGGVSVHWVPFEVRPPPEPLIDPRGAAWSRYWTTMSEEARREGLGVHAPARVPWTRKAHELGLHAVEKERFPQVRTALFRAFLTEGRDLGRVDVLVEVAEGCGLDPAEAKATLDVDRYAEEVARLRAAGEAAGVKGVPTLVVDDRYLEGIPSVAELEAFLNDRS